VDGLADAGRDTATADPDEPAAGADRRYALDPFGGNLVGPITDIGETSNYHGSYNWPQQLDWHR